MALPVFPDFRPLTLATQDDYKAVVDEFESYSDFNFVSLFTWDTLGEIKISLLNDNMVIILNDYVTNELRVSFLGTKQVTETINTLIAYCRENKINDSLYLIPEVVIDAIPEDDKRKYTIDEDRDNHDYVLSVDELAEFRTTRYGSKKSWYNNFIKHNSEGLRSGIVDITAQEVAKEMESVVGEWQRSQNRDDEDSHNEFVAIRRCLEYAKELKVQGFGVYINDKMIGFQIFEVLPHSEVMDHYEKADVDYKGVFEYIKHEAAKHLASENLKFINMEQDLGLPGLRQAKESYRPIKFLKKFTVATKT